MEDNITNSINDNGIPKEQTVLKDLAAIANVESEKENPSLQTLQTSSSTPQSSAPNPEAPQIPGDNAGKGEKTFLYGQFKDADALYNGYKNLLSEFTKRTQRLKDAETKLSSVNAQTEWSGKISAFEELYPKAKALRPQLIEHFKANPLELGSPNCLEKALLKITMSADAAPTTPFTPVNTASTVVSSSPSLLNGKGRPPETEYKKPVSISEASKLAESIFKNSKQEKQ